MGVKTREESSEKEKVREPGKAGDLKPMKWEF